MESMNAISIKKTNNARANTKCKNVLFLQF